MAHTLFITATPGTGKSTALPVITSLLEGQGFAVTTIGDKKALMDRVEEEVVGVSANEHGQKEGEHSILLNPNDPWYDWGVLFKDGHALNMGHEVLLQDVLRANYEGGPRDVLIVEWAIGQDKYYPGESLTQSPAQFVRWLEKYRLHDVAVLDIFASLEVRVARNNARNNGYIPEDQFRAYFRDEPFTPDEVAYFGDRYMRIVNENITEDQFLAQVRSKCETFFLPHLRGERPATTLDRGRR
jgi:hypothetical protein